MTKIKICGITCREDVELINEFMPEYAGFVMFYPKSRRNISCETAQNLIAMLDKKIKRVAVTVSPTAEQADIIGKCGFDFIQIHGCLLEEVLQNSPVPILKAFNVSDIDKFDEYSKQKKVSGFVFDAASPGSGKTFDWSILDKIPRNNKLFVLAGGLNSKNVEQAVRVSTPDVVDVSSGVENDSGFGKDRNKIAEFIGIVRNQQQ